MALELSFLSTAPKITRNGAQLCARSSVWQFLQTLCLHYRSMKVDRAARTITVVHHDFFLLHWRRVFRFDEIRDITYTYKDMGWMRGMDFARNALDCYKVNLELLNGHVIELFWWFGEGEFQNEGYFPDWIYWSEYLLDVKGSQKRESLRFYEMLRAEILSAGMPHGGGNDRYRAGKLK